MWSVPAFYCLRNIQGRKEQPANAAKGNIYLTVDAGFLAVGLFQRLFIITGALVRGTRDNDRSHCRTAPVVSHEASIRKSPLHSESEFYIFNIPGH
jgi:hypothetical protein